MPQENFSEEQLAAVIAVNTFLGLYQQVTPADQVDKVNTRWRFAGRFTGFMPSLPN